MAAKREAARQTLKENRLKRLERRKAKMKTGTAKGKRKLTRKKTLDPKSKRKGEKEKDGAPGGVKKRKRNIPRMRAKKQSNLEIAENEEE